MKKTEAPIEWLAWLNTVVRYSGSEIKDQIHLHSSLFHYSALVTRARQTQTKSPPLSQGCRGKFSPPPGNQLASYDMFAVSSGRQRNLSITLVPTEKNDKYHFMFRAKRWNNPPQSHSSIQWLNLNFLFTLRHVVWGLFQHEPFRTSNLRNLICRLCAAYPVRFQT